MNDARASYLIQSLAVTDSAPAQVSHAASPTLPPHARPHASVGVSLATFLLSLRLDEFLEPLRSLGVDDIAVRKPSINCISTAPRPPMRPF